MHQQRISLLFQHYIFLMVFAVVSTTAHALDAPRDPRGTVIGPSEIKWEWSGVTGATQYQVNVNGAYVSMTGDTHFYSRNTPPGNYTFTVQAANNEGRYSSPSQQSNVLTIEDGTTNNTALPAPKDPRGTVVRPAEIKWEWANVPGASDYEVIVNGTAYRSSTLYLYSKNLPAGEHTMTVRAANGSGQLSAPSNAARASTTTNGVSSQNKHTGPTANVDLPSNVRGIQVGNQDIRWTWARAQGATGYQVYLDGAPAGVTSDEYLYTPNLSSGNHSIGVAAIDSQGRHTDQARSPIVTISGDFNNNNNGVAPPPPANDTGLIDPASWNYPEVFQKPGYELVFSDEFNSNTLNRARWHSQLRWDGEYNGERYEYRINNGENQFYVNPYSQHQEHLDKVAPLHNPFEFDGQRLAIRAIRNTLKRNHFDPNAGNNDASYYAINTIPHGRLRDMAPRQPFLSGAISTHDKFVQKYGYFEARIKIPNHVGTFPAFWMNHQRKQEDGNTTRTEIDIMENLGHNSRYVYNAFHTYDNVSKYYSGDHRRDIKVLPGQVWDNITGIGDYSLDYHIYAAEWTEGRIRYFIDGIQVNELYHGRVDHEPLYLILNLAVGGDWTNKPTNQGGTGRRDAGNPFPSQQDINEWGNPILEIDYVRAYKRK